MHMGGLLNTATWNFVISQVLYILWILDLSIPTICPLKRDSLILLMTNRCSFLNTCTGTTVRCSSRSGNCCYTRCGQMSSCLCSFTCQESNECCMQLIIENACPGINSNVQLTFEFVLFSYVPGQHISGQIVAFKHSSAWALLPRSNTFTQQHVHVCCIEN